MSLGRSPDNEALEDAIRAAANDLNGYVNLPEKRSFIQREYEEKKTGRLNAPEVSHDNIRNVLEEFTEDTQKDIEHVGKEVYSVNPFGASPEEDQEIIDRIEDAYRVHIVFGGETLRRTFDLPMDHADYFVNSLVDRNLLQRLSRTHDVYTIGGQLEEHSDAPGIAERLANESTNGIITNDKMEKIVDGPVVPAVTSMFKSDGHILDLDGEFLVLSASDDFESHLANQIEADVRDAFDSPVLLESDFESVVQNQLKENSSRLSKISNQELKDGYRAGIEDRLRERLGIESRETDDSAIVVVTTELEDTVQEKSNSIYAKVEEEEHATARSYHESAEEEVSTISIDGGELVNEYLRDAVLEEVWSRIQVQKFNREGEA